MAAFGEETTPAPSTLVADSGAVESTQGETKLPKTQKRCSSCTTACPVATKKCRNEACGLTFPPKEKDWNRVTSRGKINPTSEREKLEYRADCLHDRNKYNIVVMYHCRHAKGHSVFSYGTVGKAAEFLGDGTDNHHPSKEGRLFLNMFSKFFTGECMKRKRKKKKKKKSSPSPSTSITSPSTSTLTPVSTSTPASIPSTPASIPSTPASSPPSISSTLTFTPASTPAFTPASIPSTLASTPAFTPASTPASTFAFTPASTPAFTPASIPSTPASKPAFTPASTLAFTPASTPASTPAFTPASIPSTPASIPFTPASTPVFTTASTSSNSRPLLTKSSDSPVVIYRHLGSDLAVGYVQVGQKTLHGKPIPPHHKVVQLTWVRSPGIAAPLICGDPEENGFLCVGQFFALPIENLITATLKS